MIFTESLTHLFGHRWSWARIEGQTIAIDATRLEASAAMRSIRRRDDGRSHEKYLPDLAQAEGIENPTLE